MLTLTLFGSTSKATAHSEITAFGNIPWYVNSSDVRTSMQAQGFKFVSVVFGDDLVFTGSLSGQSVIVYQVLDHREHRLVKSFVLIKDCEDVIDIHDDVRVELTGKYGPPARVIHAFAPPYTEIDSHVDQIVAISSDKGIISEAWGDLDENDHLKGATIHLRITKDKALELSYESARWAAESNFLNHSSAL